MLTLGKQLTGTAWRYSENAFGYSQKILNQLRKDKSVKYLFINILFYLIYSFFSFTILFIFLSCCFDLFLKRQLTSPKILPSNHNSRGPHRYGNGCLVTDKAPTPPSSHIVVSWLVGLCFGLLWRFIACVGCPWQFLFCHLEQPAMRWLACPVAVVITDCVWCIVTLFCIDLCTYWSITINSQDCTPNQLIGLDTWYT